MTESKLHVWWRTVIISALLDRPLSQANREVIESASVELDGTQLVVCGGAGSVIASPVIADLMTEMIGERPPPAPLVVERARFPEMPWRKALRVGVPRKTT